MPTKLPLRLVRGKFVLGPDYYNCSNTGFAPALLNSRVLHKFPGLSRGFRFAVGPHMFVEDAITALTMGRVADGRAYYERLQDRRTRVRFFKTYRSAKAYFTALVSAAEAVNADLRAEHRALAQRAKGGDLSAALALLDR